MAKRSNYDVVLVTCNRITALKMSLPLMMAQSAPPSQIIVVDTSDDHEKMRREIEELLRPATCPAFVVKSPVRSIPAQRNVGLSHVTAPIVMFPDDDSLWFPGFAGKVVDVYEKDREGRIAGVTGVPSQVSPLDKTAEIYRQEQSSRIKSRIQPLRNRFEARLFPKPFDVFAYENWERRPIPAWFDDVTYRAVETVAGFRMSFRSDAIKSVKFDETLGYGVGYAQHEDMDASLAVQQNGQILAAAQTSRVFHHVFPGARTGGFNYGFCQIANYLYICCKAMDRSSRAWAAVEPFLRYKLGLYMLGAPDTRRREIYLGARSAWHQRHALIEAGKPELVSVYKRMMDQSLHKRPVAT